MYRQSSHAIMQKQILAASCILHMPRLKAMTKHLFAQLTVTSLFLPSYSLIVLAFPSYGLALELTNTTERLQFTASTRTLAHQNHGLYFCFMPLTGCVKKTAWAAWKSTLSLTETMLTLTEDPHSFTLESVHMQRIEWFVVLMYSKTCSSATGSRSLKNIPPIRAALFQHVKRSLLQASFIWKQSTTCHQTIPVFHQWGWEHAEHS